MNSVNAVPENLVEGTSRRQGKVGVSKEYIDRFAANRMNGSGSV